MFPAIINPLPLLFAITATFGVLVHDMQVDRATAVALALPSAFATFAAVDAAVRSSEHHVHVERASMPNRLATMRSANLPRIQPRDEDRRYSQSKRIAFGSMDSGYIWPSI